MLPNRVWIKNDQYEIVYQKVIDNIEDIGYCDDKKKIIYIKLGLDKKTELDTFIHELLHAIQHKYKLRISHNNIDKLGTALAEIILLNKLLK